MAVDKWHYQSVELFRHHTQVRNPLYLVQLFEYDQGDVCRKYLCCQEEVGGC